MRLGSDRDGRLRSISHEAVVQTARHAEFVEQVTVATRMMYAAPDRFSVQRVARLDVPIVANQLEMSLEKRDWLEAGVVVFGHGQPFVGTPSEAVASALRPRS